MAYGQEQAAAIQRGSVLNGGGYSAGQVAPAPSPVMAAQQALEEAIGRLLPTIDLLENKLGPVLTQTPAGKSGEAMPEPYSVADRINQAARRVDAGYVHLQGIIERLEV